MKEITSTALVTYQYTTGPQSVVKSVAAKNVAPYVKCRYLPLSLATTTACVKYCQPFWFALAVENPFECELSVCLKAHLEGGARCVPSLGLDGVFTSADICRGASVTLLPRQTATVHFCAMLQKPKTSAFCINFCLPQIKPLCPQQVAASVSASYCTDEGTHISSFSNVVEIPLCC